MFNVVGEFTFISGSAEPLKDGRVFPKANIDQNGTVLVMPCELEVLNVMERFKDYRGVFELSSYGTNKNYKLLSAEPLK